jgi:hypothetical protein
METIVSFDEDFAAEFAAFFDPDFTGPRLTPNVDPCLVTIG